MKLTSEIAQPIVTRIMESMNYNINIMDDEGIIVASGDKKRLYKVHQGARMVIESNQEKLFTTEDTRSLDGIQPGVNLPISFQHTLIGVVGVTGDPNTVADIARVVKITVESLLSQQYLSKKLLYKKKAQEEWILDLIHPTYSDVNELEERAFHLKIDTSIPCSIILLKLKCIPVKQNQVEDLESILPYRLDYRFYGYLGSGIYLISVPLSKKDSVEEGKKIATTLKADLGKKNFSCVITIGYGRTGIDGYRKSYQEAIECLNLQDKWQMEESVVHIHDWGIDRLLIHIPYDIQKSYFSHFMKNQKVDMESIRTLQFFLERNLTIRETAEALHIHRNTLLYRLDKIKSEFQLDPRNFQDAMTLKLFLLYLSNNEFVKTNKNEEF